MRKGIKPKKVQKPRPDIIKVIGDLHKVETNPELKRQYQETLNSLISKN